MSNSLNGKRKKKAEKNMGERDTVQLGNGAIMLPDKKSSG